MFISKVCVAGKPATLQLPTRILRLESGVGRIGESHFCFVALLGADKITGWISKAEPAIV